MRTRRNRPNFLTSPSSGIMHRGGGTKGWSAAGLRAAHEERSDLSALIIESRLPRPIPAVRLVAAIPALSRPDHRLKSRRPELTANGRSGSRPSSRQSCLKPDRAISGVQPTSGVGLSRRLPRRALLAYHKVGGPNHLLIVSATPDQSNSPTQTTYPSGRINTALGAVTAPSAGRSHTPSNLALMH